MRAVRGRPPLIGLLDPPADRYLRACVEVLRRHRGTELIGAYLYGSGVIGTFLPGRSDVDVVAVVAGPLRRDTALALARQVTAVPRPYGVKGMDLAVVSATAAATRSPAPRCEMKLLTFWGEPRTADEEPEGDRRMVMHFACCLDHGIALTGPHPAQVFAPVAREAYLSALRAELAMRWLSPQYRVLNACRDWRYAAESVICSKTEGGRWARDRLPDPWLVDAALQWQTEGAGPVIDVVELEEFLRQMEDRLLAGQAEPPVPVATAPRTWTGAAR